MIQFYCKLRTHFYQSFAGEGERKLGNASENEVVTEDAAPVYPRCITRCQEMSIMHYLECGGILRGIIEIFFDVDP